MREEGRAISTPSYAELVATLRREGESLAAVGRLGVEAPVPTCPGWSVGRLLPHVGRVYRYATDIVETRRTAEPSQPIPRAPDEVDPVDYLLDGLDSLVTALGEVEPDTPVWNWSSQPHVAAFWARRMAHESLVHRLDAQLALDVAQVVDVDLAVDAVDELFDTMLPRLLSRQPVDGLTGTLHLTATDTDAEWAARLTPEAVVVSRGGDAGSSDVSVTGKAAELLLLLYNRGDRDGYDVDGDVRLLDRWRQGVHI